MSLKNDLTVVSCELPRTAVDPFLEVCDCSEFTPTFWENVETNTARLDVFLEDAAQADGVKKAVEEAAAVLELPIVVELSTLPPANWQESWKRFFHTMRVSKRIVVRPSWEPFTAEPDDRVITLDPGMSFGTGQHGTTQGCLVFLDDLAAEGDLNRTVVDMGCGSGILAIGAKLLGFPNVTGFDNDPDAVRIAGENAELNGVAIPFTVDDLAGMTVKADIVVANILAVVLIAFADNIARATGRELIVSGILDEQYPDVLRAFETRGFREVRTVLIAGWRSGHLRRG